MMFRWHLVLYTVILLSIFDVKLVNGKRRFGGGHSYPKSVGLSGGGNHGYPSSSGLSGNSHRNPTSSHGYPSSGGLSGGGNGYPSSGGHHGYPSSGGTHGYPSSGGHGYPASGGLSGNSQGHSSNKHPSGGTHTTNIYNNYHYTPPQQIKYTPVAGGAPVSYPVYRGTPPTYVYNIKDSGSKYGPLLTGLALLNLGTLAGTAYAISHSGSGGSGSSGHYKPQPGEVCKFGIKKDNGDYEETRIDCQLISSFILQEEAKAQNTATNTSVITTTVTNVTTINMTNSMPESSTTTQAPVPGNVIYMMLANGTLVPLNATVANTTANVTAPETSPNNPMTSSVTVTTTTTNTTVTNALDVKGKPIAVTPGMQCFVMRTTSTSRMRKSVPCGLLQTYAEKSSITKSAAVIISVCWVAGAGVGLLPLFGWYANVDSTRGCYFVEVMDYNYLLFLYFATIVTPSVLLAAFYAHIYRVVVKQLSEVMTVGGSRGRLTGGGTMLRVLGAAQKREVKATQNLAIIVFFFILCWMPLYTINAIKAFMPDLDIPNPLTYFCIIFSHLNSAINPLLYAYHLKDFRAALKGLLCSLIGRGVPIPAAYRPPAPIRRPALERCNALRERPKVYVNSPVWLRQREAESLTEENTVVAATTPVAPDVEPFLNIVNSSSGCQTPEARDNEAGPYLIDSGAERCQSPYKKVEELIRRVRSVSGES